MNFATTRRFLQQGAFLTQSRLACIQQAEQLFDKHQLDGAVELAKRALRMNPAAAPAYQVLGLVSLERDRPQEAIPRLKRALILQPDLSRLIMEPNTGRLGAAGFPPITCAGKPLRISHWF